MSPSIGFDAEHRADAERGVADAHAGLDAARRPGLVLVLVGVGRLTPRGPARPAPERLRRAVAVPAVAAARAGASAAGPPRRPRAPLVGRRARRLFALEQLRRAPRR